MYLTDEEQKMLNGNYGKTVQTCMKVLVKLGEIYGADHMISVNNVHSPGVSYRVAGDAGLNYVLDASKDACFCVPTTLNTIGIDSEKWEEIGFDRAFSEKQMELSEAYHKLGAIAMNTCSPFLHGNLPMQGEHIAWGESSAVAFINSVVGARTNREGGPTALAAAITGRVPAYGLHLDENRQGKYLIIVDMDLSTDKDFAVLGYFVGKVAGSEVPVIDGIKKRPTLENFKALSASIASSGAVALYHVVGFTPEAPTREAVIADDVEPIIFNQAEYEKVCSKFHLTGEIDFVVLGCPHTSIIEMKVINDLLKGKKVKSRVWICTSRQIMHLADKMGYVKTIEESGAEIICDTCPVLCQTIEKGYKTIATNSGKMAHYAPGQWHLKPVTAQNRRMHSGSHIGEDGRNKMSELNSYAGAASWKAARKAKRL
jgi:predicted aconitase